MLREILCIPILLCIVAPFIEPVAAARTTSGEGLVIERVETNLVTDTSPDESEIDSVAAAVTASINIRNLPNASTVMSLVPIIVKSSSTLNKIYYRIDSGTLRHLTRVGSTYYYRATWNTTASTVGWHHLTAYAKNSLGATVATTPIVHVYVTRAYRYALYYEVDYMTGHKPPVSVLTYLQNYWKAFAIQATFKVDDVVSDPTPNDGIISDTDFWKIEKKYNDVWKYDDRAFGNEYSGKYTLNEKWILYGTCASNTAIGGYTFIARYGTDVTSGNYIFVADSTIDNWEAAKSVPNEGGEEVVALHEGGHSIGIAKLSSTYTEVYDTNYYSAMSKIRLENTKYIAPYWYYSKEYWITANLSYYKI